MHADPKMQHSSGGVYPSEPSGRQPWPSRDLCWLKADVSWHVATPDMMYMIDHASRRTMRADIGISDSSSETQGWPRGRYVVSPDTRSWAKSVRAIIRDPPVRHCDSRQAALVVSQAGGT